MYLKLMSDEDLPDGDIAKGCKIIGGISEVTYGICNTEPDKGKAILLVTYDVLKFRCDRMVLEGNAYLMNDNGKTIQSFACHPGIKDKTN